MFFFDKHKNGELVSKIINDPTFLKNSITKGVVPIFKYGLTSIFLVIWMFSLNFILAFITFAIIAVSVWPINTLSNRMFNFSINAQTIMGKITSKLSQLFINIKIVKLHNKEQREYADMKNDITTMKNFYLDHNQIMSVTYPMVELFFAFAIFIIMIFGGTMIIKGKMNIGDILSFITATSMLMHRMQKAVHGYVMVFEGIAAAKRIASFLKHANSSKEQSITANKDQIAISGPIKFTNVSFDYDGVLALDNISIEFKPKTTYAIVGKNGAGKSTILNLLVKFYKPKSGKITIGGKNINDIPNNIIRDNIMIINQEILLFNDTIMSNIMYGSSKIKFIDVQNICIDLGLHDFISNLPLGYNTIIGESGVKLSGGQKQKIILAKAMLSDCPYLVIDEGLVHMDVFSSKKVSDMIFKKKQNKTIIIITHKTSTAKLADTVYVIDNGVNIGSGIHDGLMKKNKYYIDLCKNNVIE